MAGSQELKPKEARVARLLTAGHSVRTIAESTGMSERNVRRIRSLPHVQAEVQERATAMADAVFFRSMDTFGEAMDTLEHMITAEDVDAPGPGGGRYREAPMVRLKAATTLAKIGLAAAISVRKEAPPIEAAPKMRRIVVELGGPEGESAGD